MTKRLTTNIVPPIGPLDAPLCIIGQAPGEEEDYAVEPFVGAAGQFFKRCLRRVDVLWSECLVRNVFSQRPPKNDVGYFFEDKSNTKLTWEGVEHVEELKSWLQNLNPRPNVLLACGREAMLILTGKRRVWKWRGSILPCILVDGYKVYITLHPSGVMRLLNEPTAKLMGRKKELANNALPLFLRDLERAKIQAEFPEIRRPIRKFEVDLGYEETIAKLEWINAQNLHCAVDIETFPDGPEGPIVWKIGFAPSPDYAFSIPILSSGKFAWPLHQEAAIWRAISTYFLNPKARKIFQNGGYDLSVLGRYYGLRVADDTYCDSMWCHQASFPQIRKSLETLVSIYTWEPYYKDEGKITLAGRRADDHSEGIYNAKDCCCTREVYAETVKNCMTMQTAEGYKWQMRRIPSLLSMMIRGVRIDIEAKARLQEDFKRRVDLAQNSINAIEGEYINPNSPKQLIGLLYYKHQLKEQRKRTPDRQLTTDKDALNKLLRLYHNKPIAELIQHILDFRKFSKLHGTYAEMSTDIDNRIRTSYGWVSTWRLSSSESHFGAGGNLQNIPVRTEEGRMVRRLFIPDRMKPYSEDQWPEVVTLVRRVCGDKIADGLVNGEKLMLASDLVQAEAMVVAWESEDIRRIRLFREGVDVHWENARDTFDMPRDIPYGGKNETFIDRFTNEPHTHYDLRRCGKTIKHATNYGMGPFEMQAILAREGFIFPFNLCKELLRNTKRKNPELKAWHENIQNKVRSTRCLISSYGRRRYFFGRFNDNTWRAAYAFSPQNSVGEIVEDGIQTIEDQYPWIENLLNVHDEDVTQIEPHTIVESIKAIKQSLEIPLTIKGRTLIIPTEFKAGPNWGDLYEFEPQI